MVGLWHIEKSALSARAPRLFGGELYQLFEKHIYFERNYEIGERCCRETERYRKIKKDNKTR